MTNDDVISTYLLELCNGNGVRRSCRRMRSRFRANKRLNDVTMTQDDVSTMKEGGKDREFFLLTRFCTSRQRRVERRFSESPYERENEKKSSITNDDVIIHNHPSQWQGLTE